MIFCDKCREYKEHAAKGLCGKCYRKQFVKPLSKYIECKSCGELKPNEAFGLCQNCYRKIYNNKNKFGVNENISQYFSVYSGYNILKKLFDDNVKVMLYGNKGYKFICGEDKIKVSIKSSSIKSYQKSLGNWNFGIRKNVIADYFLCIGFGFKKDIKHVWFFKGDEVNKKINLSISKSKIDKWEKYEIDF